jgi:subfamily B ATP-binding cassette protein MsbA
MNVFEDLGRYLGIYRKYIGRRLYIVFLLTIAASLAEGFGIALLLPLLQASKVGKATSDMGTAEQMLFDLLQWMGIADSMVGILGFIGIAFVGKGLLKFAEKGYRGYLQADLLRDLETQMFDAYMSMDFRYYIQQNTGHFINVINSQVRDFFLSFGKFANFLGQIVSTVSYFTIAFLLTWRFALMALGVGAVLLFVFKYLTAYVRRLSRRNSSEMSRLHKLLMQALQSFKYIVSTDQVGHVRTRVMKSIRRLRHFQLWRRLAGSFTTSIREPLSVLFIIAVIAVQVTVFQGPIAPIFVSLLLFHRGMQAVIGVQGSWQSTMEKIGAVEMVDDEFDAVRRNREKGGTRNVGPLSRGVEFRDVCFAYDEAEGDVLTGIDVTIPANTTAALVGESGAGKSTLVDMLTLLLKPRTGKILVDGIPGREADLASWRSQIGYVSQETVVFDDTIANNISLWAGDPETNPELREQIHDAARQAYAHRFIEALPEGYQTVVGDQGVRLSGGQRQRLFIARELFKNPNLLILDEATSALDTESERYIQQSIDSLKGEMTVVIIAHRLSTIKNVDYVYVLDKGRVIEEGTYEELANQGSQFREMVQMQSL